MNASQVNREFTYPIRYVGFQDIIFNNNNNEEVIAYFRKSGNFFPDLFNGYDLTCSSDDGEKLYLGNATDVNDTSTPEKGLTELFASEFLTRQ